VAEPVPLGPQLGRGQPLEIGAAGGVDGQGLAASPGQCLGQQQIGIRLVAVGQVQLAAALGFGTDHGVEAGVVAGPGQLHIQPVDVFAAGQSHQSPPASQPLGAVASRRVGQVHSPVALPAAAVIQIGAGQGDRPTVGAVQAES
jgi:hypothetical protein